MPGLASRLFAALLLFAAAPLLAVIALIVLIGLGRPILFVQTRSGLNQRPFRLYKYRTMMTGRTREGRILSDAERTPPVGRILRRTRADELLGLVNVVRGELALVGPRPLLPETLDAMGELGRRRARVAPGITGWAQINGNALLSNDQKFALDIWYIENRSPLLDARILMTTILVALFGERIFYRRSV